MTADEEKRAFLRQAHERNKAALDRLGEGLRCVCGMPITPCSVGYTHSPEGWMGPCTNPRRRYTREQLAYRPEAFVRMRLDEAEADARQVLTENQGLRQGGLSSPLRDQQDAAADATLADVKSKRHVLDIIQPDLDAGPQMFSSDASEAMQRWGKAHLIACALAEPFADHEDYHAKWAPEGTTP